MRTVDFITKEMGRRKWKAAAGISCILLGISIFVAAQTTNEALYEKTKEQLLRFGANIIVQPKDEPFDVYSTSPGGSATLPETYVDRIRNIEHSGMLVAVSPKLYERFEVGDVNLLVVGITDDERKAKPWWMINKMVVTDEFPRGNQVLLGNYASAHLEAVSEIKLNGETFTVTGVLDETGSSDDFAAFVPLGVLQDLTGKRRMVNVIEVSTSCIACPEMNLYDFTDEIDATLPDDAKVTPVKQIAEAQMETLAKIGDFTRIIYIVVLCLGSFLMMNYMSSSVSERRREIGILVAIGMDVSQLYKLFISKALILGVVGGSVGFAVGTLISMVAGPQIADTAVSPIFQLLPYSILISTVICIVSSLLPARRAARLDPVEALREV